MEPHKYRRSTIHFWILAPIVAAIIMLWLSSCSPQRGCHSTRGMSGYSNINKKLFDRLNLAWLKCRETGKVIVTDMNGNVICTYYEKPSTWKEQ